MFRGNSVRRHRAALDCLASQLLAQPTVKYSCNLPRIQNCLDIDSAVVPAIPNTVVAIACQSLRYGRPSLRYITCLTTELSHCLADAS
jgi:hypothetical protein